MARSMEQNVTENLPDKLGRARALIEEAVSIIEDLCETHDRPLLRSAKARADQAIIALHAMQFPLRLLR